MKNNLLGLNKEQIDFVNCEDDKILLLACAGSGKSLSVIRKISGLMSKRYNCEKIYAISFTRAAADELNKRISKIDRKKGKLVKSMTFHSMCIFFLKKYINKNYSIASEGERNLLKQKACDTFRVNDITKSSSAMNSYKLSLRKLNLLDIELVPELMLEHLDTEWFKERVQSEISHLFYDEAQDINEIQYKVISSIIPPNSNKTLCFIGDYSQNIYAWNGTNPKFLLNFKESYNATTIMLNKNYRSSNEIIEFANNFIENSITKIDVQGFFNSTPVNYQKLSVKEFEIKAICDAYSAIQNNQTLAFIARRNSELEEIISILASANIPYSTSLKTPIDKSFINFARVCINPTSVLVNTIFNPTAEESLKAIEEEKSIIEILALNNTIARRILDVSFRLKKINAINGYNLIKKVFNKNSSFVENELDKTDNNYSLSTLENFLNSLETNTDQDNLRKANIYVTSIHGAKGLEYDNVIMYSVNSENFKEKDIEENLRLLYVAVTRARHSLTITYLTDKTNKFNNRIPSESALIINNI